METPCDHEVEDEPIAGVESEGDPFAEAADFGDFLASQGIDAGLKGTDQKGAANADLVERFLLDAGAERFDVNRNIWEFRQFGGLPCLGELRH